MTKPCLNFELNVALVMQHIFTKKNITTIPIKHLNKTTGSKKNKKIDPQKLITNKVSILLKNSAKMINWCLNTASKYHCFTCVKAITTSKNINASQKFKC